MTLPIFPTLPGQGWSVKKTPTFSTRVATHVSGREVRVPLYAHGLYAFELAFDGLDSSGAYAGLQAQSLQSLMAFYLACQGQAGAFVYIDPDDNAASNVSFGQGDGVTTQFTLQRSLGGYSEPASYVTAVSAVSVAGSSATGWSLIAPNTLAFPSAPASGAALFWSGSFGFQCRFTDDSAEFEKFMSGLWMVKSLKFRSVR